jgi:hypothetical protein
MSVGAPVTRAKMTLCGLDGKSKITDPPTLIVIVNGTNESPGIDTVNGSDVMGGSVLSPPHDVTINRTPMSMQKLRVFFIVMVVLAASAAYANAQSCLGLPSFAHHLVHVNAAADFPDSATVYAVGVGAGHHNNLFGNLGGGQIKFEGFDSNAKFGFLEFGYQIPIGKAQICPIAGGTFASGPDDEVASLTVTSRSASAGLALGMPFETRMLTLIPNAAVHYGTVSQKVEEASSGSSTFNSNSGLIDVGLAFVIGKRISIQPLAHIPFAAEDDRTSYGVFISVGVGK